MTDTAKLEYARGELNKTINDLSDKYGLTAIELEGVLCKIIVNLSWSARIDMLNNCESEKRQLKEKNEELHEEINKIRYAKKAINESREGGGEDANI